MHPTSPSLAVIGAGIVGICTALQAQSTGYSVTLIDPESPGSGCSLGNAGHFATEQVFPLADPSLLPQLPRMLFNPLGPLTIRTRYCLKALPWFLRFIAQMTSARRLKNTAVLRELCEAALPAWQQLLSRHRLQNHLTCQGSLLVFESTDALAMQQTFAHYRTQNVAMTRLDRAALDAQYPGLGESITSAIRFDEVGHTSDPLALSQALHHSFVALGGKVVQRRAHQLHPTDEHIEIIYEDNRAGGHKHQVFDKAVICAGVYSKKLCQQLGYDIPLEAERGYHLATHPASQPAIPVASYDRKFIMTPMNHSLRLAGTVEFAGLDAAANPDRSDALYQHACALWPALAAAPDPRQPANRWMGMRPSLPDSLPVISNSRWPSVWFNFGHQHLGLTLAAISAQRLCDAMLQQKTPLPAQAALSIERFL